MIGPILFRMLVTLVAIILPSILTRCTKQSSCVLGVRKRYAMLIHVKVRCVSAAVLDELV